jgi:Flp pilus assembly protein TadG
MSSPAKSQQSNRRLAAAAGLAILLPSLLRRLVWPGPQGTKVETPGRTFRSEPRRRHGASLVEFAFVAPVFFVIVLGIFEFGRACMVSDLLTEAARQGCRQGVIEGTSSADIEQAATSYLASVGISGDSAGVSVNGMPVNQVDVQNYPAYTDITVIVTVPVSNVTWVPTGFLSGMTLQGQFTTRRE